MGKAFFGSLCAGTFSLGVWQVERLVEKIQLMDKRNEQLAMEPSTNIDAPAAMPFRRLWLQGILRHDKEVLIGPRSLPAGVHIPMQGLSAKIGATSQKSSGLSSGPQGYFVLTPLELAPGTSDPKMVWINRGWVPKHLVPGGNQPYRRQGPVEASKIHESLEGQPVAWSRPTGSLKISAVRSQLESE
jgi:surfeit locus 1 family protein